MTQTVLNLIVNFAAALIAVDGSWVEHYQKALDAHSQGNYAEAEQRYRSALKWHAKGHGPANALPILLNNLGSECQILGKYDEAERLYHQAIEAWRGVPAQESGARTTLTNLAAVLRSMARYTEAVKTYEEALREIEQAVGTDSVEYAGTLAKSADLHRVLGNLEIALPMAERAAKIATRHLASGDPALAVILQTLACVYLETGRWGEAEHAYERTRVAFVNAGKGNGVGVAAAVTGLGRVAALRGDFVRAERFYRDAAGIYEGTLGRKHVLQAVALNNLAQALKQQERFEEADPLFLESIEILTSAKGHAAIELARSLGNYADSLSAQGKAGEAGARLKQAIATLQARLGPQHREVALLQVRLAAVRHQQRSYVEAANLYRAALPSLAASLAPADDRLVGTAAGYAQLLKEARMVLLMR